jgi:hypoxanthine phosphoribosyltransferase
MVMGKERKRRSSRRNGRGESVRTLITGSRIQKKIREMARKIRSDFPGEPLHLVGVLKGAVFFLSDLARQIPGDVSFDFIAVSSYGKETRSSGQVKLTRDLDANIEGKTVIVVEDILDTGLTLQYLLRVFEQRKPKRLRVAVLLDKQERRIAAVRADYVGFTIPNEFVVGYGLDYDERYRNLPHVAVLSLGAGKKEESAQEGERFRRRPGQESHLDQRALRELPQKPARRCACGRLL